jgi:hypothetical protein
MRVAAPPPARGFDSIGRSIAPPAPMRPAMPRPYVRPNARWVGHDERRGDVRFRTGTPWARGRFSGGIGRGHTYRLGGWETSGHRFWFGNSYFALAPWEAEYADDWSWEDDQVVLYDDPDHDGWYLAYNVRLGTYVHAQYDGPRD